jgi:ATP adenylyltransferase
MKVLWAPWRIDYILAPKPEECVLCVPENGAEDGERLILHRGGGTYVIMNKYPYNCGHLMVAPYRHVMSIEELDQEESAETMHFLRQCAIILQKTLHCGGLNLGLNIGEAAGAGIREHLHFHIVPRWNGDSSFMAVMDETRVMPQHLRATYATLKPHFDALRRP